MNEKGSCLETKIREDKEWYKKNILTPKFFILNFLTFGMYGWLKMAENMRRVGLN